MIETQMEQAKKWLYEKCKSKSARYFVAGLAGMGAVVTVVVVGGALELAAIPTIIIAGATFVVVSVVTNRQIASSVNAQAAIKPLQQQIADQAVEIAQLKNANKKLKADTRVLKAMTATTLRVAYALVDSCPDEKTRERCEKILAVPINQNKERVLIAAKHSDEEKPLLTRSNSPEADKILGKPLAQLSW